MKNKFVGLMFILSSVFLILSNTVSGYTPDDDGDLIYSSRYETFTATNPLYMWQADGNLYFDTINQYSWIYDEYGYISQIGDSYIVQWNSIYHFDPNTQQEIYGGFSDVMGGLKYPSTILPNFIGFKFVNDWGKSRNHFKIIKDGVELFNHYEDWDGNHSYRLDIINESQCIITSNYGLGSEEIFVLDADCTGIGTTYSGIQNVDRSMSLSYQKYVGFAHDLAIVRINSIPCTIDELITEIDLQYDAGYINNLGIKNSFEKQLDSAKKSILSDSTKPSLNKLSAFINHVDAQENIHVEPDTADLLRAGAYCIMDNFDLCHDKS